MKKMSLKSLKKKNNLFGTMSVTITDQEKNQKELLFSLTPQEMEPFLDSAAQRLSGTMKVKGFREGHVPRKVVEQSLGVESVWREAVAEAVEESYIKVVEEHNLEPISRPRVDITKLVPDNNLEFKVLVPVSPQLELPDYLALAREVHGSHKEEVVVEDKEVDDALAWLQKSRVQKSDLPADETAQAGEGKEPELPALDDAFAQSLGDFETMEDLKGNIRDGIQKEKEDQAKQKRRLAVLEAIRKKLNLEISDLLIENELDRMQDEFAEQVAGIGLKLDEYLEKIGKDAAQMREGWKERAEERVATALILRAIADKEGIDVPEEDLEREANKYLMQFGSIEEARKQINPAMLRSYIRNIMRNEKVFEVLEGGE
ncbi:MAG: trigger factor [Candidatus Spechtbacterales bacterium]